MHRRRPIRLLLREHGICGGVETVNIHLVQEFTHLVERVVWIVPDWRMDFLQQVLPPSERLVYEPPFWPARARLAHIFRKATSLALRQKVLPARFAFENVRQALFNLWLKHLVQTYNITHFFCNWTLCVDVPRLGVPIGAMVMDVRWKRFPETFPQIDIDAADRQFCNWLREAHIVFPVSETTASDIRRFYPWHTGRTQVVPHGAEIEKHDRPAAALAGNNPQSRCAFFCPAAANGHKNHITLFRACAHLFSEGFDFDLILTGFGTEHFRPECWNGECPPNGEAAIEQARAFLHQHDDLIQGRIKALGYVDRAQINALYNECSAVVLPSLFEGFGLPLIEALETGAVVICSDISAHREQLTRYGCIDEVVTVPPTDAAALTREMKKVIVKSRQNSGQKRVPPHTLKRWTWRNVAEAYLDSLVAVPGRNNGR